METKQKRTVIVMAVALVGLLTALTLVMADDSKLNAPPHLLIQTLQEIREAIVSSTSKSEEKVGYCQFFEVQGGTTEAVFTVPSGKRFVLLKLYARGRQSTSYSSTDWSLTVDDNPFIDGSINEFGWADHTGNRSNYRLVHDFPDRCVVVESGQNLKIVYGETGAYILKVTIIGYFYDVE